ncbi:MAG TPA: lysophospholipid acyltransferase family protein [Acidimicrobiales bacterium]
MSEVTYTAIIRAAKLAFRLLGQRIDITGAEHIPRTGGALLAVNHIGYVDFVYAGFPADKVGRRVRFMAKRELFDHRISGPLMRAMHHIPVDRADGESSFEVAKDALVRGELVGIFPEATISRAMEVKGIKTGAVRIAAAAGVPLIPVVLWGTQRLMTKDHDKDFGRGKAITIRVGAPIPVTGLDPVGETALLRTAMSRLLGEAIRGYPQHEPGAWWVPASYGGSAPTLDEAAKLDAEEKRARARARRAAR